MWDYKEGWVPKNWCLWTVKLEKTLESPLDSEEIKPVHPKGNQSWIFTGRTDAEALTLWPPDVKNWLIGKDPDAGKDWRWEKGTTEDEMVGWHHWLHGQEFEQASGVGDGQGSLECCSPWGLRVRHDWAIGQKWTETCPPSYLDLAHHVITCLCSPLWGKNQGHGFPHCSSNQSIYCKQLCGPWSQASLRINADQAYTAQRVHHLVLLLLM